MDPFILNFWTLWENGPGKEDGWERESWSQFYRDLLLMKIEDLD